jgi:type IV pilus assembly protein PilC
MSNYAYVAIDPQGLEMRGTLEVADQSEALRRIKEMGLFPTKVVAKAGKLRPLRRQTKTPGKGLNMTLTLPGFGPRVKAASLTVFTRQLATLLEAGMPLLRSLRTLQEQETDRALRQTIGEVSLAIENGGSFAEAVSMHPKVFNDLYLNMVKAGEIGGALDVALRRLAEFMEKSRRIKGKVKSAMYYPCCVMTAAFGILVLLMVYIVPKFQVAFEGLLGRNDMPAFTCFVLHLSELAKSHLTAAAVLAGLLAMGFVGALRTQCGRRLFDAFKLAMPILGPVFRKVAISRFSRTLGTLVSNGVPILQALAIVKQTVGNVVVGDVISNVHERVKEGDPMAPALKSSRVFPAMVAGMVEVGEQTGALPEMLMKVADNYDDEVDNAVNSMTSLLEPIMILFLAVVVGSIVIAMFMPLIKILTEYGSESPNLGAD